MNDAREIHIESALCLQQETFSLIYQTSSIPASQEGLPGLVTVQTAHVNLDDIVQSYISSC